MRYQMFYTKNTESARKGTTLLFRHLLGALCLILFMSGCAGTYGRLKLNTGLDSIFSDARSLPDYTYYYTGRSSVPDAVIGIRPDYTLKSRLWHPALSKEEVVRLAEKTGLGDKGNARGAVILDHQGNEVGIWFSTYTSTTVLMNPDGTITVYSPYSPSDVPLVPGLDQDT